MFTTTSGWDRHNTRVPAHRVGRCRLLICPDRTVPGQITSPLFWGLSVAQGATGGHTRGSLGMKGDRGSGARWTSSITCYGGIFLPRQVVRVLDSDLVPFSTFVLLECSGRLPAHGVGETACHLGEPLERELHLTAGIASGRGPLPSHRTTALRSLASRFEPLAHCG